MPDKEELIQKAEEILKNAEVSAEDFAMWQGVFAKASLGAIALFVDLMVEDTDMLEFMTDNIKKKIAAGRNPARIDEIVDEEKEKLEEYLNV